MSTCPFSAQIARARRRKATGAAEAAKAERKLRLEKACGSHPAIKEKEIARRASRQRRIPDDFPYLGISVKTNDPACPGLLRGQEIEIRKRKGFLKYA
jgi:hypothetical protein